MRMSGTREEAEETCAGCPGNGLGGDRGKENGGNFGRSQEEEMRMKLTTNKWLCAGRRMGIFLIAAGLLRMASGWIADAQALGTTTVQGTVYLANGQPGTGSIEVSWPAFTTANNLAVAAGRMAVPIAADGFMSVNLTPNQGATPAGLYYTAVYHRSDGTTSTEYWVVPAAAQVSLGQVRAKLMPAAQAVQAVSKAYVDQSISALAGTLLMASGGTMTGPLYLNGDPTQPLQAADKHYVDAEFGAAVPLAGGNMAGPLTDSYGFTGPLTGNVTGNVTGTSSNVTGIVQLGNGGTGAATAAGGLANLGGLPLAGGALTGALTGPSITATQLGGAYQVDQFAGADFGAKLQACLSTVSATFGGICDARNFAGSQTMASNLTISTANTTVLLPCATISTANQILVTAGTRNVALKGCALRGASTASGSQGGTVFLYSGTGAMVQVGDPTYAVDTNGFHLDNVAINTTASGSAAAQGLAAYRTQEMDLESLYFLGNSNQTGMTLDGTGNYTGGTFLDNALNGFQTAVNAIGHQVSNPATTDWLNASTFVRLHIDCPTSGGSPIAGTYGINLQQGDGNTFTGGDVEGCSTALHLGPNAQNNTLVGVRNENSTSQVVADAGSAYNNWMTGGTMFTGQLTDNGTRNSFLDTFHRSFNGMNGDWYGSQKDATVTNHYRVGTGAGNERGLLNRYQSDYGYRWTMGLSDAAAGEQFYQVLDELNNVYRLSIGQYNHGQSSTNNQTVVNAAGTGAVVLNGSANAGTGGVVFGAGGASGSTVATISNTGNAQFNGTLQVAGTSQSTGTMTVRNNADAEVDYYLWPGLTASQKGSFTYKDWNGNSQWYMVKDASNNWALNSAIGGLDSFKAYQSTNSGDTYIDASNSAGVVRVNYETGSGAGFNVYGGNSSSLYASFTGTAAIKFPGLAAGSGHNCLQIDTSGYITNTGSACGSGGGGGGGGTVSSGTAGQIAYYTGNGTSIGGIGAVPVTAGGTGASTAAGALAALGAQAAIPGLTGDGAATPGIHVPGAIAAGTASAGATNGIISAAVFCTTPATPDESCFNNAFSAFPSLSGYTVLAPAATVVLNNPINIPTGVPVAIQGQAGSVLKKNSNSAAINAQGALTTTTTTLAADAPVGTLALSVASSTGFSAGQWIQVWDGFDALGECNNPISPGTGVNANSCNLELARIESVSGNTLNLKTSLDNAFTVANGATATVVTPSELTVEGIHFDSTGQSGPVIEETYNVGGSIDRNRFTGGAPAYQEDLYINRSRDVTIAENDFGNSDGILASGGSVVPFTIDQASAYVTVANNRFYKIVESGLDRFAHHILVTGNTYAGCADDCINTHGNNIHDSIVSNNILGGEPAQSTQENLCIVLNNGPSTHYPDHDLAVEGNQCANYENNGFYVDGHGPFPDPLNPYNLAFRNNTASNPLPILSAPANTVGAFTASYASNVEWDNNIANGIAQNQDAWTLLGLKGWKLIGNSCTQTLSGVAGDYCFYANGANSASALANGLFVGNQYNKMSGYGVYLRAASSGAIDQLTAVGNSGYGPGILFYYQDPNVTNFYHIGNTGEAAANLAGVPLGGSSVLAPLALSGNPASGRQIQVGTTGNYGCIGSGFLSGSIFAATNACQTANGADSWTQSNSSTASQLWLVGSSGIQFYVAPASISPGTLAAFWGNPVFTCTTGGLCTASGGINLSGASAPLQANGSAGNNGQVLTSAGAGATPIWSSISTSATFSYASPVWRFLGDGSEGAFSCTTGTCSLAGEHWYSSVNVSAGAILAQTASTNGYLLLRSTGACTIAGAISVSPNTGGAAGASGAGTFGGGGGGGGGGAAAGSAGSAMPYLSSGAAGTAAGGSGGAGSTLVAAYFKTLLSNGATGMTAGSTAQLGGSAGGSGGSSGPAGGKGGTYVALVCQSIAFTGAVDASGVAGGNSTGNNIGAAGGGGGGTVVFAAPTYSSYTGTMNVSGGAGGSCLSYTGCGAGGAGASGNAAKLTIQ